MCLRWVREAVNLDQVLSSTTLTAYRAAARLVFAQVLSSTTLTAYRATARLVFAMCALAWIRLVFDHLYRVLRRCEPLQETRQAIWWPIINGQRRNVHNAERL